MTVFDDQSAAVFQIRNLDDYRTNIAQIEALARAAARSFADRLDYHGFEELPALTPPQVFELLRDVISDVLIQEPSMGEACDLAGDAFNREFTEAVGIVMKGAGE